MLQRSDEVFPYLNRLPEDQRDMVALACGLGDNFNYGPNQIAYILKLDVGDVKRGIADAISILRETGQTLMAEEFAECCPWLDS